MLFRRYAIIAAVTLPLIQAPVAFSSHPDSALPGTGFGAAREASSPPAEPAPSPGADGYGALHLLMPTPAPESRLLKQEFTFTPAAPSGQQLPGYLMQRGEYRAGAFSLLAEMGDIRISESPNTVQELSRRGGRLALETGSAGNALRLQSFASLAAGGSGSDGSVLGATGELSSGSARFKTVYLSERQALKPGPKPTDLGEKRGDVFGVVASWEPFQGRLNAEAELDLALYDPDSGDDAEAYRDTACRLKLGGEWGRYRYQALYERTGPEYRLMGGTGPKRDWEGISLGLETAFRLHALDLRLSRYRNNTGDNPLYPRLNRYEGSVDYSLKAIRALPLGLRYRKTFIDSDREPLGHLPRESEEDAVSGRANYLAGRWDLGVLASFSQRTDRIREAPEASAATLAFLPKFAAGALIVAPDFSLKRSIDFPASLRTDQYAVGLGINGTLLEKKLDYELRGGFKEEWSTPAHRKQTLGANLKAAYPLVNLFKGAWRPILGLRGEYSGTSDMLSDRGSRALSLHFTLEGRSLL